MTKRRRITAATLILVALACGGCVRLFSGGALSYAQCHSLKKGMTSKAILNAFGPAVHVLEREGRVRGLSYRCENANGEVVALRLVFSRSGRLEKWALTAAAEFS